MQTEPATASSIAASAAAPSSLAEVDPRVMMANERTLLAWIRTGVGLMAFGFVVGRAAAWVNTLATRPDLETSAFRWTGSGLIGLGVLSVALGWYSYLRTRAALLAGHSRLPKSQAVSIVSALMIAFGLALAILVVALGG